MLEDPEMCEEMARMEDMAVKFFFVLLRWCSPYWVALAGLELAL